MSDSRGTVAKAAIAALIALAFASAAQAQDAAAGETVFNKCKACHQVGEGAKNRVGPPLNGIVGAAAGQTEGFRYSPAMAESGLVWDEATLTAYLRDPRGFLPGAKMTFAGLSSDEDLANLIAFLAGFAADGTTK